jgi:hypothetical protein
MFHSTDQYLGEYGGSCTVTRVYLAHDMIEVTWANSGATEAVYTDEIA